MKTILLLPLGLAAALMTASAQAAVYTCADATGAKTISDKPCPPAQTTQKVQKPKGANTTPAAAGSEDEGESAGEIDDADLQNMTLGQLQALMAARLRQSHDQEDGSDAPKSKDNDATRHMKAYLRARGQLPAGASGGETPAEDQQP